MTSWYVVIPLAFAAAYALAGGIEFGLPLLAWLFPAETSAARQRFGTPVWEVTNVFLVGAITSVMALYPRALPILAPLMQGWWLTIGALLIVRGVLVLTSYYLPPSRLSSSALALVSLTLPVAFGQLIAISLAGSADFASHWLLSLTIGGLAVVSSLGLAVAFTGPRTSHQTTLARAIPAFLVLTSLALLPTAEARALLPTAAIDSTIAVLFVLTLVVLGLTPTVPPKWLPLPTVLAVGAIGWQLASLQLPYILRPALTFAAVQTNQPTASVIAVGFALLSIIAVPTLWWLYWLIRQPASDRV